jgi:hypothetical protein
MSIHKTPTFLLALSGLFLTFDGVAQQNNASSRPGLARYEEPRFRMGLHLLPSIAWLDARDGSTVSDGSIGRFGFGFTADIMFADNYAIGTGVNVFRNGGKMTSIERLTGDPLDPANDTTQFVVERERTLTQHWVELPVTFKFRTRQIGHITYWGQFGLGLGLNLRATADDLVKCRFRNDSEVFVGSEWVEDLETGEIEFKDVPVEDEVALMRAAMILGLGIEYNLSGKTALLLGATFNNGLFNVANNRNFGPTLDEEHLQSLPVSDTAVPLFPEGYDRKMVDNAILLSLGLLF